MSILDLDQALIWHPFTQNKIANLPIPIVRGEGAYLFDEDGNSYLDVISSWWVNLHGHSHPTIAKAIYEQALKLEHIIFAGFTHSPAVTLCKDLSYILPKSLSRFFFSDNGSTAVEAALKMAYQFWKNKGENNRKTFLSFEGGYHGDTFGAMSVGRKSGFHSTFEELFFNVHTTPFPATWRNDSDLEKKEHQALLKLSQILATHGKNIAAFIAEPLIQGASGMRVCRSEFLAKVIDLIRKYEILIIFDEIMTGFGRTGSLFAFNQIGQAPDILCLSKGLSGGFLPLALTIVKENIYEAFLDDSYEKAFLHGHSYTANPLGCAAAIISLKLLLQEETQTQIKNIAEVHTVALNELWKIKNIKNIRQIGTIAAFDLDATKINNEKLKKRFLEKGLLIRPLGNTIYLLPPYCISTEELKGAYNIIEQIINNLHE